MIDCSKGFRLVDKNTQSVFIVLKRLKDLINQLRDSIFSRMYRLKTKLRRYRPCNDLERFYRQPF